MIRIFFGSPGCGKTTTAIRFCKKHWKKVNKNKSSVKNIYCNFENKLARQVDLLGLGTWVFPEHSHILIDEAGIVYNSRKYKALAQETIEYFKLHRHYKNNIDVFSQSFEDMDVTLRRLADELWYVRKLGPFTMLRRIYKRVGIDETTHQIVDFYEFGKIFSQLLPWPFHRHTTEIYLRRPYYKFFDSYEKHDLPLIDVYRDYDDFSLSKILNKKHRKILATP